MGCMRHMWTDDDYACPICVDEEEKAFMERKDQPPKPTFEDALKREAGCYSNMLADMKLRNSDLMSMLGLTSEDHFRKGAKWGREYGKREALACADKEFFKGVIDDWIMLWMNQKQNSEADYQNYFRRAMGVDANMRHSLARLLTEAFEKLSGGDAGG